MPNMPPIYFGPITPQPSWAWVGEDIAKYLSKSIDVRYFTDVADIDEGSLVFWIKCPPDAVSTEEIRLKELNIVFFPVDAFLNQEDILTHREFINNATLICLHARSLASFFRRDKVEFVDHYNKYGVPIAERRPDGRTLLWIGGFQYVPYVLCALDQINWPRESIVLLTNHLHGPAKSAAEDNAVFAGLSDFSRILADSKIQLALWSEDRQREALLTCAAAFDVKYINCFNQLHKPPTKIQKYLVSGIPCAINHDFPATQQVEGLMRIKELRTDLLPRHETWRSSAYRALLSKRLRIDSVSRRYIEFAVKAVSRKKDLAHVLA
ncbi:hypothetical protein J2X20_004598 [Pelomonas saccharophila]|uniref:Glycosyltransferase n=1 Tax=Roseateles saccharophilus TaxID=304 RepID=A0ABU1YSU4_ROSSA|nr:hypothetical protein [Roseateles saccharophilus]MDR7271924.1 hypothetical protein [Roseateles saccharophilus]